MDLREFESTNEWCLEVHYPLNRFTVLDYFKNSPYYDHQCNNEIVRSRQQDRSALLDMVGVEYELDTSEEVSTPKELGFVIRKQYRESPTSTRLLSLYYVVTSKLDVNQDVGRFEPIQKGTIIPMPDLNAVIMFNINAATYYLERAMAELAHATNPLATKDSQPTNPSAALLLLTQPASNEAGADSAARTQQGEKKVRAGGGDGEEWEENKFEAFGAELDPTTYLPELRDLPEATATAVKANLFEDTLNLFKESIQEESNFFTNL